MANYCRAGIKSLRGTLPNSLVSKLDALTHRKTEEESQLADGRGGVGGGGGWGWGWRRIQIIRPQERLFLYKSLNTLSACCDIL
jgi:hypothetical protein